MQKYIDQLLEDMAAAQRPEEDSLPVNEPFSIEQHFEEVERWLKGEEPEPPEKIWRRLDEILSLSPG
jgi:hypothetical protein